MYFLNRYLYHPYRIIKINSFLALVKAMRRNNFVYSEINLRDEIYIVLRIA